MPAPRSSSAASPATNAEDPRTARSKAAVLEATIALMVERGSHAVSVDAIVERSGVAKTTVYRHWPTREALLADAWREITSAGADAALSGTVHEQVRALALGFAKSISTRPMSVLLPDLVAAAQRDESMRRVHEDVLRTRRRTLAEAVEAGVREKALPADTDADLTAELIIGALFYRRVVLRKQVGTADVDRVVTAVLDAAHHDLIRAPRRRRPS